jgi:hypothetical protein
MGPMTGRARGYCAGFAAPGYTNIGFGMGRGRGFRRIYFATGTPGWARYGANPSGFAANAFTGAMPDVDEKQALQSQAAFLESQLTQIRKRLKGFEEAE